MDCSMPASLSIANSRSLLRLMSIKSVMPSNHLILFHPLLVPPLVFPSITSSITQSCPTLCDLMEYSPPGSSVCGVFQARILEWVAISFSRGSSQPWDRTQVSCIAGRCFNLWATREGSFQMSQLFTSGGQSVGVSASASVLSMNIQDWFPLGWTGWISLQSKGLSRAFSNTTVQKHQLFSTQLSLWSNSHIHTWLLEKP